MIRFKVLTLKHGGRHLLRAMKRKRRQNAKSNGKSRKLSPYLGRSNARHRTDAGLPSSSVPSSARSPLRQSNVTSCMSFSKTPLSTQTGSRISFQGVKCIQSFGNLRQAESLPQSPTKEADCICCSSQQISVGLLRSGTCNTQTRLNRKSSQCLVISGYCTCQH